MRTALVVLAAFACGLLARELVPAPAKADTTITLQSAGVTWETMTFRNSGGGAVGGTVCGHTTLASGGNSDGWCVDANLGAANATAIDVQTLGNGKGVALLKTAKPGL
jgi:hypothetical protein